jgi:hypothetical protein
MNGQRSRAGEYCRDHRKPIRASSAGQLDVRGAEIRGERRCDIRQSVTSTIFEGFTTVGVSLSSEELGALLERQDAIRVELESRGAPAGDRPRRDWTVP